MTVSMLNGVESRFFLFWEDVKKIKVMVPVFETLNMQHFFSPNIYLFI